jgi:iron complex outermembrane recepter protein
MKMKYTVIGMLLLMLTGLPDLFAQKQKDTATYNLPYEITITAPRLKMNIRELPSNVSILNKNTFSNLMSKSIGAEEPLRLVPGVRVENQADGSRLHLSVRGTGILSERGIRGTRVILDNIPVNDPTGFAPDFYDVDWGTVDNMEVLRGVSSSTYGASSSAGIINIITQDGGKTPLFADFQGTYGTYNFWKGLFQFGANANENVNYRMSASRMMGDGYRDHSKYWANNIYGKGSIKYSNKLTLTPVIGYTQYFNENPEGLPLSLAFTDPTKANPDSGPKNEYMKTDRFISGLSGIVTPTKNHEIYFMGFFKQTGYVESVPSSVIHRSYLTPGATLQYTFNYFGKKIENNLSVGADYQYQKIDEYKHPNIGYAIEGPEFQSNQEIKQSSVSAFAVERLKFAKFWSFMGSIRYDKIKNELVDNLKNPYDASGNKDFDKATGKVGLSFAPMNELNVYANFGQGFLPPCTEELVNNPKGYGGFNQDLVNSTSTSEELGLRGILKKGLINYDITGFHMNTENDFDRYRIPERPLETFYRNIGKTERFGVEVYADVNPIKQLALKMAYTFSDFRYKNEEPIKIMMDDPNIQKFIEKDNYLPNIPQHMLFADLEIKPVKDLFISINAEVLSRTYIDGANLMEESVPGFALYNAMVKYAIPFGKYGAEVSFAVKNIFDRLYIAFTEPDPGGNSYQPGADREVFGAIKLFFK